MLVHFIKNGKVNEDSLLILEEKKRKLLDKIISFYTNRINSIKDEKGYLAFSHDDFSFSEEEFGNWLSSLGEAAKVDEDEWFYEGTDYTTEMMFEIWKKLKK